MDSPFASANTSFTLYLEPILNTFHKTYQNVITLNVMPTGPLQNMVSTISTAKLSPFQQPSVLAGPYHNCKYVLLRYPKNGGGHSALKSAANFMGSDDIPSVISYLQNNGYTIDTNITNMLNKSRITIGGVSETGLSGDRRMICIARYTL